jgi:hypothetical protein
MDIVASLAQLKQLNSESLLDGNALFPLILNHGQLAPIGRDGSIGEDSLRQKRENPLLPEIQARVIRLVKSPHIHQPKDNAPLGKLEP